MNILDHAVIWAKGEAFEMTIVAIAGAIVLLLAGLVWKLGTTPVGQALPIPLTVVAAIFLSAGISGILGTSSKIEQFESAFKESSVSFVQAEKARVEKFDTIYNYTIMGAAIAFAAAIIMFKFYPGPMVKAIAIAIVITGAAGLIIDMFSAERAQIYMNAIDSEISLHHEIEKHNQ